MMAPKIFETLLTLVRNPGRVLDKDELLTTVWSDTFVEEASLTNSISALRKILGERPNEHCYIVTVPGRGYRFVADVRVYEPEDLNLAPGPSYHPPVTAAVASPGLSKHSGIFILLLLILMICVGAAWWAGHSRNRSQPGLFIAVFPFLNVSGDAELGYFSEGLAEQLAHSLSVDPGFNWRAAPSTSNCSSARP